MCEFKKPISGDYLGLWLRSQFLQDIIRLKVKSGAQGKLALKRIKTLPFPTISYEEQQKIVAKCKNIFGKVDFVEEKINKAFIQVDQLTQSILSKAFSGELTAEWRTQNPDLVSGENSAQSLLVQIQKEREALKPTKKRQTKKKV